MKPDGALKISKRSLYLAAGVAGFIAAFSPTAPPDSEARPPW